MKHENNPIQHILKIKKHLGGVLREVKGLNKKELMDMGYSVVIAGARGGEEETNGDGKK